jgi:hypothetical protein
MKAGFYCADITPPVGAESPGSYRKRFIQGVRDPLKARACVMESEGTRVALVGLDTIAISAEEVKEIRVRVNKLCGIKENHILIAASHTHSGGTLRVMVGGGSGLRLPDELAALAEREFNIPDEKYSACVIAQTVSAICEADRRKEDCLYSVGSGIEDGAVFNRRFRMKQGVSYTHPGKGNPDIVEPAGPVDPQVGVVAAWRADGSLIGCIVNYACHGTTVSGALASADWIGRMEKVIKGAMNPAAEVVFLNGACGDVTQVDNLSMAKKHPDADRVGMRVGAEAVKVLVSSEKSVSCRLAAATNTVTLRRRQIGENILKESERIVSVWLQNKKTDDMMPTEVLFSIQRLLAHYFVADYPVAEVEIQAIQVGAAIFLANPAEYFCSLGLDIKRRCNFPFTFVVELANGCVGYVPDSSAFSSSGGGYETIVTLYSNLEVGAGELIADECVKLSQNFIPHATPQPDCHEQPLMPWSYGAYAPDR